MQLPAFPRRRLIGAAALACAAALIPAAASAATAGSRAAPARHAHPLIAYVLSEPTCPGGTVTPIDTATNTALKPITVPPGVTAIAITPNRKTVYVSSGKSEGASSICTGPPVPANTVTPISTATNKPGKPIYVGSGPGAIAVTPNGRTAYVLTARGVVPIRTATGKPGKPITGTAGASVTAITPDGATAYVVNGVSGTVTPIRTATNTALPAIKFGTIAHSYRVAIGITPDGATAYVLTAKGVVPIWTATNTKLKVITGTGGAFAIAITPDGKTAYVLTSAGVVPIRTATNTKLKVITGTGGASAIAITPNGSTAYVTGAPTSAAGYFRTTVTAIRAATNTIRKVITIKSKLPTTISAVPPSCSPDSQPHGRGRAAVPAPERCARLSIQYPARAYRRVPRADRTDREPEPPQTRPGNHPVVRI